MTTINLDYQPNAAYYGDCEEIIQAWKEQGVQGIIDLIYLDPPFNSNRNYGHPTSKAKKSDTGSMDAFSDMWDYNKTKARQRIERIVNEQKLHPAHLLLKSLHPYLLANDPGMLVYLTYMADRLRLFHGLLRDTGSIYLHCDPFANYYLRLLMDSIFGQENFRNEIVWHYGKSSNAAAKKFLRGHDTILFYAKDIKQIRFERQFETELSKRKKQLVDVGYNTKNMNGQRYLYIYDEAKVESRVKEGKLNMESFDIVRKVDTTKGNAITDAWEIDHLNSQSKENEGYKTQKPLALLDRIIKASTNEGDLVLDPFCGCGTAMHSAIQNKRRFIGMDISVFTIYEVARKRLKRECGLDVPIYGIPTNFAGAKMLFKTDPFKFEAWAAESLTFGNIGIISNKIKRGDKGIDGSGLLYGETEDGDDKIIVQVKGGGFTPTDVRAFKDRINSIPGVAAGIFITMDGDNPKSKHRWTKGMESEALDCGTFQMPGGDKTFRRMQHWSVRDRFKGKDRNGVYPLMPIMINPFNNEPMVEIDSTIPNKPLPMASKPAKRNRRRNGKTKADLF